MQRPKMLFEGPSSRAEGLRQLAARVTLDVLGVAGFALGLWCLARHGGLLP